MLLSLEYSSCMHMILIICTFSCMKNSFHSRLLWSQYVIILLNNWPSRAPAILLGHVQNHLLTQQIVNIFVRFLCSLCFNLYVHFISKLIMLLYSSCPKSAEDQCRFHSHWKVWWLLNLDSFVQLNLAAKVYNFAYKFWLIGHNSHMHNTLIVIITLLYDLLYELSKSSIFYLRY